MARAKKTPAPEAPKAEPVAEAPKVIRQPRFSSDGVLLNPEDCNVSSDGVVTAKQ